MTMDAFQAAAARTARAEPVMERRVVQALGLCGEAGELANLIKKSAWHGRPLSDAEVSNELGDVLWYVADLASAYGLSLSAVAEANVAKLWARYPEGFTADGGQR